MTSAENSVSEPPNLKISGVGPPLQGSPRPYKKPSYGLLWVRKLVAVRNNVSRGNCCPYLFEKSVIIFLRHQSVSCSVAK